jgi:hypothetical protein
MAEDRLGTGVTETGTLFRPMIAALMSAHID